MLKLLRFITTPVFAVGVLFYTLLWMPWLDSKRYAVYLVTWKWADKKLEDDKDNDQEPKE